MSNADINTLRQSMIGGMIPGILLQLYYIKVAIRFAHQFGMENKQGNFQSA